MDAVRRRLQALTWFALVGVLALALLPTVSHALAFAGGGATGWSEVCTPRGLELVALEAGGDPAPASGHLEHCPLCQLGSDTAALPPAPPAGPQAAPAGDALPPGFRQAPPTLFAWAPAHARAPPAFA